MTRRVVIRRLLPPDEAAVERCLLGDPPAYLSHADRYHAILRMTRRGNSASQISRALGISPKTVQRARSFARAAGQTDR